ncbi:MAG: ribosomal RNA small subunit methyltransferase A [Syntrophus sp. (in: bacteria)]|nr:ribosomal RNA small subunit methyltransferase A [Syntrophus sp. (in: bacteria)]
MMTTPKEILRTRGIRPRKRLGQSFLQDLNIANKIIDFADIQPGETVVEIGAGLGVMTGLIAAKARRVIAVEIDPFMIDILHERLQCFDNVDVVAMDVLKFDFFSVCSPDPSEKLKIVGNVPYHISSPILFRLLDFRKRISSMILMLQKEVADRIRALPGGKEYGIPSVMTAMFCTTQRLMDVPAGCFYPEPKVVSSILKIGVREKPVVDLQNEELFRKIVRLSFAKRRKTLLNNLRHASLPGYPAESMLSALQDSGMDGMRRAETLSAMEFGLLSNYIISKEKA